MYGVVMSMLVVVSLCVMEPVGARLGAHASGQFLERGTWVFANVKLV